MNRLGWCRHIAPALLLFGCLLPLAQADFELTNAQGRRILLKDDGTWRYVDAAGALAAPSVAASGPNSTEPTADLSIVGRREIFEGCVYELNLHYKLPYEIRALVFDFKILRPDGVLYVEHVVPFTRILPGDQQLRNLPVRLECGKIGMLQVAGGDRCDMGELNKFTDAKGVCLSRVSVIPSKLISIRKADPVVKEPAQAASAPK